MSTVQQAVSVFKTTDLFDRLYHRLERWYYNQNQHPYSFGSVGGRTDLPEWFYWRARRQILETLINEGFKDYIASEASYMILDELHKRAVRPYKTINCARKGTVEYYEREWDNMVV